MTQTLMNKATAVLTMVAVLAAASCSNEDEVMPTVVVASAVDNQVLVSIHDTEGNNLAGDTVFLSRLQIDARNDKRAVHGSVKEIDGVKFISFGAPLPREDRVKWNADRTQGRCQETVVMSYGSHRIVLGNNLLYSESPEMKGMLGGSSLIVESVTAGDTLIRRDAEKRRIVVPLIFDNAGFHIERNNPA